MANIYIFVITNLKNQCTWRRLRGVEAPMTERCLELDSTIRSVPKSRSLFDPELRNLRADLQNACKIALTSDFRNAQVRPLRLFRSTCVFLLLILSATEIRFDFVLALNFRLTLFIQRAHVDSILWKHVFYKPIEEFRRRLAKPESLPIREKVCVCVCVSPRW